MSSYQEGFPSHRELAARRAAIIETVEHYRPDPNDYAIGGTAAWLMHGIDGHEPGLSPGFDVDAMQRRGVAMRCSPHTPLPLSAVYSDELPKHAERLGYANVQAMFDDTTMIDGIRVLNPAGVARGKKHRNEPKDRYGTARAQRNAMLMRHPILQNPSWRQSVHAMLDKMLTDYARYGEFEDGHPEWVERHIKEGFTDPMFQLEP